MFDLSWSHIAILVVVALLVLGPKELPNAIRTGAQLLRAGRKLANEFRSGVDELVREAELEETRKAISQAMTEGVQKTLEENVDPQGEIKGAISADYVKQVEADAAEESAKPAEPEPTPAPEPSILPPAESGPPAKAQEEKTGASA